MKAFVVFAVIVAVASARVRTPTIATVLEMQGKADLSGKIIGGELATLGQFPWQSSVSMDNSYLCGGSIVNEKWILTAAHCVDGFTNYRMALGELQYTNFNHNGARAFFHPSWDASVISNDVGLINVVETIQWTANIAPTTLPAPGGPNDLVGTPVTVSGWGRTSEGGSVSQNLQWTTLTTISNADCAAFYGGLIGNSHLCTRQETGRSTCNGDSGGPLILSDGSKTQVGVVSFVSGMGCTQGPHGFARLPVFVDWVRQETSL